MKIKSLLSPVVFGLILFVSHSSCAVDWKWDVALTRYASARQIAVQSDGKIVIAGDFDFVGRVRRAGLARLNEDGSLDAAYRPFLPGNLLGISPLGDRLLIATVNGPYARLQLYGKEGELDTGFVSSVIAVGFAPSESNQYSFPAKLLPSGKILLIGGATRPGGRYSVGLLLLNPDGSLDETFRPPDLSLEMEFSVEASGSILVISGRGIDSVMVRLDGVTGEILRTFSSGYHRDVFALPSGKFLVLGDFSEGPKINRYLSDGLPDSSYTFSTPQELWRSPLRLSDGRFIWLGSPTLLLNAEGDLIAELPNVEDFDPNYGAIAETTGGKFIYSAYPVDRITLRLTDHGLKRRLLDGMLDSSFHVMGGLMRRPADNGFPDQQFTIQYGLANSFYISGPFGFLNGTNTGRFVRLKADHSIDPLFLDNIRSNNLAPGYFTVESTDDKTLLVDSRVRLNAEGESILVFPPLPECIVSVKSLPLRNGASIHNFRYVGPCNINGARGSYSTYLDSNGNTASNLELKQDGLFPGFADPVAAAVAAPAPGKFLIGGRFTSINGSRATNIALMTADGKVDPSFQISEYVQPPGFLFRRGDQYIGVVEGLFFLIRSFYIFDLKGNVLIKKDFPASIVSVQQALLNAHDELIIVSRGYEPNLLISVFDLEGNLLREARVPYTFSDYQRPSAALSPEGDLLVTGSYFDDETNAWTGIIRISAGELIPLRLDLLQSGNARTLLIRARPGASIGVYESDDLKVWRRESDVEIPQEGSIAIPIQVSTNTKFISARLEWPGDLEGIP